jgi:hypothetical protein
MSVIGREQMAIAAPVPAPKNTSTSHTAASAGISGESD